MKKAIVLLSGGLDSAVTLAYARKEGYAGYALTVDYGQRHAVEINRAKKVAVALQAAEHKIIRVDLRAIGGSALTDDIPVPSGHPAGDGIPVTYVPARNTVLLSLALSWAEVIAAESIFIGVNAVDYSGYPDCRPDYLEAFERMAALATKAGVQDGWRIRIQAPLLRRTKAEIVRLGLSLHVDFGLTSSCYNPDSEGRPCGACDSCQIRAKGFQEAGEEDPVVK
jgi:7-cyano-7-deazaguanine synthase